ncbi:MAG: Ig-like domain-containing protein [Eubacterium sp.]|nr:Ig-like domain-containing protein [Eubacterium sp.]
MKAFKKALAVLMVFAMVITTMTAFDVTSASAKVKSIKVAKKVTVSVGKTATVKVKVKTTGKTSKKFTVKVSKKKIVKVTKKKGKIKIKGLKAGTVKITIKSKANKKKKKTIKVTVVNPDVKMSIKQVDYRVYKLSFSKAVKIKDSNVKAQIKRMKSGNYVQNLKVEDVSTSDSRIYTVVLANSVNFYDGNMVKFTVTGVNKKAIVQEVEAYAPNRDRTEEKVLKVQDIENINDHWDVEDYTVSGAYGKVKSVSGVPSGLKYTNVDGRMYLKGKFGRTGVFTITFIIEDEKGTTNTLRIVYVVGSDNKLTIYCPKRVVGIRENIKDSYGSFSRIYIAGGSNSYTVTSSDNAGIFDGDPYKDSTGVYDWDFDSDTIGTKTGVFTVKDNNSGALQATGKAVVETKKTIVVKGKVTTASGKPVYDATVNALPKVITEHSIKDYDYTDKNGNYEVEVFAGTYDMNAEVNSIYSFVYDKKITGNTTQNFKISAYRVEMKSSDAKLDPRFYHTWYTADDEREVGYGNVLYFKPGTYNIKSADETFPGVTYDAKASFTVKGDMTVTANVTATGQDIQTLNEGTTHLVANIRDTYYKFVPSATDCFFFKSDAYNGDPDLYIYDEDGNELDYDTSGGGFDFDVKLTQGKTYYVRYLEYDGTGYTLDLKIYRVY